MEPKIVFLDRYSLGGADLTAIEALGDYTGYETTRRDQVIDRCREAEIVITNKVPFDRETMQALPQLRMICVAGTGMNHIDLEAATEQGHHGEKRRRLLDPCRNGNNHRSGPCADAANRLLRSLCQDGYAGAERQFHFGRPTAQLHGKTWGIIGLGNIGHAVAQVAEAFGCRVVFTSVSGVTREEPYPPCRSMNCSARRTSYQYTRR